MSAISEKAILALTYFAWFSVISLFLPHILQLPTQFYSIEHMVKNQFQIIYRLCYSLHQDISFLFSGRQFTDPLSVNCLPLNKKPFHHWRLGKAISFNLVPSKIHNTFLRDQTWWAFGESLYSHITHANGWPNVGLVLLLCIAK